jgi:Ca2+-binding RTX toxin-like protein
MSAAAFLRSPAGTALDASDRIIYDTNDRTLSYDADGSGEADAIIFARLNNVQGLTSDNFIII